MPIKFSSSYLKYYYCCLVDRGCNLKYCKMIEGKTELIGSNF